MADIFPICARNEAFCNRFINDFKVPIELPVNPDNFETLLLLSDSLVYSYYINTATFIEEHYKNNIDNYLHDFYIIREKLISAIKENEYYKNAVNNHSNREHFLPCFDLQNKKHKILYNQENTNKYFFSLDIRNANFTALKYADLRIFNDYITYRNWVAYVLQNEDPYWIDYFVNSKYSRQVIFGQCNPKFTISIEKQIITMIGNKFFETAPDEIKNKIYVDTFNSDEIVFCIKNKDDFYNNEFRIKFESLLHQAANSILKDSNLNYYTDFKTDWFQLDAYRLYNNTTKKEIQTFYIKSSDTKKLHTLQKRYVLLVQSLLSNPNNVNHILYNVTIEGVTYKMIDKLTIKKL